MAQHSATVTISESELNAYVKAFPELQRMDVLHAIVSAGPWRTDVEMELERRALNRRKTAVKEVRAVAQRQSSRQMTG